ncbi:MAG: hypothetical protein KAT65_13835, partial [Methanophagales archaeon]|nr:hypothetical protein [Methanophagales archaeon]
IFPSVKVLDADGKKVVVIKVSESAEKPVFFKNHAYKRVGKANQRISSSELRKLAKESGAKVYWDEQVCEEASLDDIDDEKVRRFLRRARFERRLEIDPDILVREALERLKNIRKLSKSVKKLR